ncbi:Uncharacterised protein [Campylobacter jejuni]|nr:Uncharacterised protein [Campylobacter jejuni]
MPVNIFDIPPEEKTTCPPPSLWIWGGILVCIVLLYMYSFLVHFPQYLSKNIYIFWSQLLIVPFLIWGGAFLFRVILWNNENIEVKYWNATRTDYYQELLIKGRLNLEIIDLQIRLPDINGDVINSTDYITCPMRFTPKHTHTTRYLLFNSAGGELTIKNEVAKRKALVFGLTMNGLISDIHTHLTLLPSKTKVNIICVLEEDLIPIMESMWAFQFSNTPFLEMLEFSENLPKSIDSWLDETQSEYLILISANFLGNALLDDDVDGKSESVAFLLGKKTNKDNNKNSPFGSLYRPEYDWSGIQKLFTWGGVPDDKNLSGVVYSGLNTEEISKLVLNTADFMSESALSSFMYIDTTDILCKSPPLTEMLQLNYINENLEPGNYIIINKHDNILVSYFYISTNNINSDS